MGDACDGRAGAVVDVGHRAGDSSRDGDPAEEGHDDIGYPLGHQLGIRAVTLTDDPVSDAGREEGLDSAEEGDGEGGADEVLHRRPAQLGHDEVGDPRGDRIAVADGVEARDASILLEEVADDGHHDDGDEGARDDLCDAWGELDEEDAPQTDGERRQVDGAE